MFVFFSYILPVANKFIRVLQQTGTVSQLKGDNLERLSAHKATNSAASFVVTNAAPAATDAREKLSSEKNGQYSCQA
jgi:hypothetical protein